MVAQGAEQRMRHTFHAVMAVQNKFTVNIIHRGRVGNKMQHSNASNSHRRFILFVNMQTSRSFWNMFTIYTHNISNTT
jgi:hypothetical protein